SIHYINLYSQSLFLLLPRPSISTLFPYTTLFRSHCNNLGQAGNAATTLESMQAVAGQRAHFTHLQFHSYGGARGKEWKSAARDVDRKSTRLNSSHGSISYAVFCLKKKKDKNSKTK